MRLRCTVTARNSVVRRRLGTLRIPARPIPIFVRYRLPDLYRLVGDGVNFQRNRLTIKQGTDQLLPCLGNRRMAVPNPIIHAPPAVRVRTAQRARFSYPVQTSALMVLSGPVSFGLSCQWRVTHNHVTGIIHLGAKIVNMPDENLTDQIQ